MIKAVIFDMDGVLIDSEPLWQEAEIEVFKGVNVPLTREKCQETTGLRIDEVVNYWHRRYPWETPSQEIIAEKILQHLGELIRLQGEGKNGVKYVFQFLKEQNIKLALASSSARFLIDAVLEKLQLRSLFSVICSATEEEYGKPHPAVYLTTAKKLQILPQHCLVIEDSLNGVIAAKAAQMKCIAIPEKFPDYKPQFALADLILPSLFDFDTDIWRKFNNSFK